MAKKLSRIISVTILVLALMAVLLALRAPSTDRVSASAPEARSFEEKLALLGVAHLQGAAQTAHITEGELTSALQQSLDESAAHPAGTAALKAASVHLEGDGFVAVLTLDVSGKDLYLTLTGTLDAAGGMLQIQPVSARLGSLPIPVSIIRRQLQKQMDSPEGRERLRLPEFIRRVHIENGELLVESQ